MCPMLLHSEITRKSYILGSNYGDWGCYSGTNVSFSVEKRRATIYNPLRGTCMDSIYVTCDTEAGISRPLTSGCSEVLKYSKLWVFLCKEVGCNLSDNIPSDPL